MTTTQLFRSLLLTGPLLYSHALLAKAPALPMIHPSDHNPVLPLTFEQNRGQAPDGVRFLARTSNGEIDFTSRQIIVPCGTSNTPVSLRLEDEAVHLAAEEPTGGVANYYTGSDRSRWLQGIPLDRQLRYQQVAPGVDLVFHGRNGLLEYDLEVAAGADPEAMHLELNEGSVFHLEADGSATIHLAKDQSACRGVHLLAPAASQQTNGEVTQVESHFTLDAKGRLGFVTSPYDRTRSLVIDPVVSYTKIIGASSTMVSAMQVDANQNTILTGETYASNYPITGGGQKPNPSGSEQVFLTKLDPTGTRILYSTYLPAPGFSLATALALDPSGNAYVGGIAGSSAFPTTPSNLGPCTSICNTGFVAKFDTTGALIYSTLVGSGQQLLRGIAVDADGSAYVAGDSHDNGLKTVNAFQSSVVGGPCVYCNGAFYGKLNPAGTDWVFSSYFYSPTQQALSNFTAATSIARDSRGNIYFAGSGTDVPLKGSFQSGTGGSFVAEFAPDGKTLLFSTLLGGDTIVPDRVSQLQVRSDGTIYLAGSQIAPDFPYTVVAYRHPVFSIGYAQGQQYMFATAINPLRTGYAWSTYLGEGSVNATAMDAQGNFYVAGNFGIASVLFQNSIASDSPGSGAFVIKLDPSGSLLTSTGFGGRTVSQIPSAIAIDSSGNLYLAGQPGSNSLSSSFADPINIGTGTAYTDQSKLNASIFIAEITPANQPQISLSYRGPVLELRNASSVDLHIASIVPGSNITSLSSTCAPTLPAATSCFLTPLSSTPDGTLTINSDAFPSSQTFTPTGLSSSLGAIVYIDNTQLNFPPTQNGTASVPRPLVIWNLGNANTTINSILTFGSISHTADCIGTLAPGTSCTVMLTITPTSGGLGSTDIGVVYGSGTRIDVFPTFINNPSDGPIVFSTASLNYGNVLLGTASLLRTVTLTNSGPTPVAVNVALPSGSGASSFAITSNTCATAPLAPQASCVVGVVFEPMQGGRLAVPFTVSGGGLSAAIYLIGTGISQPTLSVTPTSANFGNVALGSTAAQLFQVTNTNSTAITFTSVSAGAADGGLQPDYTESDTCGTSLAPNGSCTITATFAPSAMGTRSGVVTLLVDGGTLVVKISLTGTGGPILAVTPLSLNFAPTPVGLKILQTITVLNQSAFQQSPVPSTTAPFSVDSTTCTASIAPASTCTVTIAFQPDSNGPQAAILTIAAGSAVPLNVPLSGLATVSSITLTPATLNFAATVIGSSANAQTVTVTNSGAAPLTALNFGFAGANPSDFSLTSACGTSLGIQQTCALNVIFKPSAPGQESATLYVSSNAATGPATVTLTGTAVAPVLSLSVSPPTVTVNTGATATYILMQQPISGSTGSTTFTCTDLPLYAVCSFSPTTLPLNIGGSTTLTLATLQNQTAGIGTSMRMVSAAFSTAALLLLPLMRRRRVPLLLCCVITFTLAGISGCGSATKTPSMPSPSTSVTPRGTYTFHVTAASSTLSQTIPLTLVVQ